jgi:GTP 3',8-cyclase
MKDRFGRELNYLRVSVVDRCNLRCLYCMPSTGAGFEAWQDILSYEEIETLVRIFAEMGIEKVRLTGGEPLVRKDIEFLVTKIRSIPQIKEIALTTNGIFLKEKAKDLKRAGLDRVNISLDTLQCDRFMQIARRDRLAQVLEGIEEAQSQGFYPIKINTVLMKGINEDEILDLVRFAIHKAIEIRFIEMMPTHDSIGFDSKTHFFSSENAKAMIEKEYQLIPSDTYFSSPARVYSIEGTASRVGFISPLSCQFCSRCNRLRLKANGALKTCLHGKEDLDLKALLRSGASKEKIQRRIDEVVYDRPEQHFLNETSIPHQDFQMSHVGG